MQIFLKTSVGEVIDAEVAPDSTVAELKYLLQSHVRSVHRCHPNCETLLLTTTSKGHHPIDSVFFSMGMMSTVAVSCPATVFEMDQSSICVVLRPLEERYPEYILTRAALTNNENETQPKKVYLLYGYILYYWFPSKEYFDLCPWGSPSLRLFKSGSNFSFVVKYHGHPLLFLNIKAPSDFPLEGGRRRALAQVSSFLDEVGPTNTYAERLYAISAIGKRWRACWIGKGSTSERAEPVGGVALSHSLKSDNPDCWNPDISSDESFVALQAIVETIKSYCT
ncbi:hypothetical protein J3A83DRAFT_1145595 [Scleroderma citrinum]